MTCTAESLIPSGPGYTDIQHQVCTLPGSVPGTLQISGSDYIEKAFSYSPGQLWRDWGIVAAIIVFFLVLNIVAGEVVRFESAGNQAKVFQKPNAERKRLNEELLRKKDGKRRARAQDSDSDHIVSRRASSLGRTSATTSQFPAALGVSSTTCLATSNRGSSPR